MELQEANLFAGGEIGGVDRIAGLLFFPLKANSGSTTFELQVRTMNACVES
jgi:hypothetical protein